MNTSINKINTYLLERYPNVWNTKLVWVLSVSLLIHILFYFLGLVALSNPESLHKYGAEDVFFDSGAIFFSVILSILIIVIWLVSLFKNNAFKAYYPMSKADLFKQFSLFFIAIFFSTSFFFSHTFGLRTYINMTYDNDSMVKKIDIANNASLFLSHNVDDYLISEARYPDFFYDNFCETKHNVIDYNKTYYETFEFDFQFYNRKSIDYKYTDLGGHDMNGYLSKKEKDSLTITYWYKDSVLDARQHIKTLSPSYYNYSNTFYSNEDYTDYLSKTNYYSKAYVGSSGKDYSNKKRLRSKQNVELLDRNNPKEIKSLLNDYLTVLGEFKVKHNITSNEWFELVYQPSNFKISAFIRNQPPPRYPSSSSKELSESEIFVKNLKTNFYIESDKLKRAYRNIDDIKDSNTIFTAFHAFIWLAFCLSLLIFIFRVTGLKTLLFSIVSVGVLIMLVSLILVFIFYCIGGSSDEEYVAAYLGLFISLGIFSIPLFYAKKIKKIIVGIALNISIVGFVPFIFLIIGIISMHQNDYYRRNYLRDHSEHLTLLEFGNFFWSYILIAIGFIFIYFYSAMIKNWKALPEG